MAKIRIYHNPRCGMSRKTLALIREKGIEPLVIEYLKTPLKEKELASLALLLRISPQEMIRSKEKEYKKLGLGLPSVTDRQLIQAMAKHPILIQRPIVVSGKKAVFGRPPENVEKIL